MLPPSVAFLFSLPRKSNESATKKTPITEVKAVYQIFTLLSRSFLIFIVVFREFFAFFVQKTLLYAQHFVYGVLLLFGEYHMTLIFVIIK